MFDKVYQRAEAAKTDYNHDMNDITPVFGSNWAGENLGFAGKYQDYAGMINNALTTISIMMNEDGGEDHWGHRENFLRNYYKDWGEVEAGFAFVWSDKYNRWVMVFDVMKYDGGENHAHDLDKKYSSNSNKDQINQLKSEISSLDNQISDLKQEESALQNKISDLEKQKDDVKFDYNKLDDSKKLDYIVNSQTIEQAKEWKEEKTKEINNKYEEMNKDLNNQISSNKEKITKLQKEIKEHQNTIAELEKQLEKDNSVPMTPLEPSTPIEPEEKPDMPNKGDGAGNTTPSMDDENSPESPATEDPTHSDEEPSESETKPEGTPNTPTDEPEEQPTISGELEDSKPETKPNNGWNPNFKDPSEIIGATQEGSHISNNGTSYEPVQLSKGDVTAYVPTHTQTARTMQPSTSKYHLVGEAEAAEVAPTQVHTQQVLPQTRMDRLHGELPQTGIEDNQSMMATGAALVTLSSLFGLSVLRRRKEQ